MSKITVSCPNCTEQVSLDTKDLKKSDGQALCPHCDYSFKLVKKSKKQAQNDVIEQEKQPAPAAKKSSTSMDDDAEQHVRSWFGFGKSRDAEVAKKAEPKVLPEPPQSPKLVKTVAAMSAIKHAQKPLTYREPKAADKPTFAEVGEPFAFNLMDRDSVNAQLPQISVQPAVNTPAMSASLSADSPQNNITIHTDSLVFTLVGDGQGMSLPSTQIAAGGLPSTQVNPAAVAPAPVVVQAANDTNWTIATIAAMAVLVMQLFYWVLLGA